MSYRTWLTTCYTATLLVLSPVAAAVEPFSHDDWTAVLQEFVDDHGLVDYEGLAADRAVFDRYVTAIRSTSPKSHPEIFPSRAESLAYYINAYNAQVFHGVLARGPEPDSVWTGMVSGLNFFVRMKVEIGGEPMSLKRLEDHLIREQFQDPRAHAVLNCASISCPRLPRQAFTPERLDEQLDTAMRQFVADPRHCASRQHQEDRSPLEDLRLLSLRLPRLRESRGQRKAPYSRLRQPLPRARRADSPGLQGQVLNLRQRCQQAVNLRED